MGVEHGSPQCRDCGIGVVRDQCFEIGRALRILGTFISWDSRYLVGHHLRLCRIVTSRTPCFLLGPFQELLSLLFPMRGQALACFLDALLQDFSETLACRARRRAVFDLLHPQRRVKDSSRRCDPGCRGRIGVEHGSPQCRDCDIAESHVLRNAETVTLAWSVITAVRSGALGGSWVLSLAGIFVFWSVIICGLACGRIVRLGPSRIPMPAPVERTASTRVSDRALIPLLPPAGPLPMCYILLKYGRTR